MRIHSPGGKGEGLPGGDLKGLESILETVGLELLNNLTQDILISHGLVQLLV